MPFFWPGKRCSLIESAHAHFIKPLAIASKIALQVVRTSSVWISMYGK